MTQKVFTFLEPRAHGAIFVNVSNYSNRITVTGQRTKAKNNGVSSDIIRATFLSQDLAAVEGEACATCTPKGHFAKNVRIEMTGPHGSHAALIATLEELVAFIKVDNRWPQGLAQPQGDDLILTGAV